MKQQNLMVINGRTYDTRSGLPLDFAVPHPQGEHQQSKNAASAPKRPQAQRSMDIAAPKLPATARHKVAAKQIHRTPQKAQTLARHAVARPQAQKVAPATSTTIAPQQPAQVQRFGGDVAPRQKRADITPRAKQVQKFGDVSAHQPTPVEAQQAAEPTHSAAISQFTLPSKLQREAEQTRRAVHAAHAQQRSSQQHKEDLISQRIAEAPTNSLTDERQEDLTPQQKKVRNFFSKQPRMVNALAGMAVVLLLIGYVTFLNMPAISMRVAISRAGFDATMPGYKPSGYSINGPVAYSPGEVSLKFASNTNSDNFTLTQKESSWDSKALLDNFVSKETNNYLTYQEKGLTVYMFDGKAAWVNGGVWYSVDGSSKLSSDQILKLATSM